MKAIPETKLELIEAALKRIEEQQLPQPVTVKKAAELTGYSESAIRNKINIGIWPENIVWKWGNDGVQLFFGEAGQSRDGQEHDGTEPADDGRRVQPRAMAVTNGALQADATLQCETRFPQPFTDRDGLPATHALQQQKSAGRPQAEENYACQPRFHHPGESVGRDPARSNRDASRRGGVRGMPQRSSRSRHCRPRRTGFRLPVRKESGDRRGQHQD